MPAAAAVLPLTGCQGTVSYSHAIPALSADAASAAGLSPQALEQAEHLCAAKCVRCHKFYHPADYSDAQWKTWMTKMSKKARLQPEEDRLLSRYLAAFRQADGNSQNPKPN